MYSDPYGYDYSYPYTYRCSRSTSRFWGMFCHVSALLGGLLLPTVGHIVGPLVVWLLKKDHDRFADDQGREVLNFQISMTLYGLLLSLLIAIAAVFSCVLIGIPFLVVFVVVAGFLWLLDVICTVIGAVYAYSGVAYRYPGSIRLL